MDDKKQREIDFHNRMYADGRRKKMSKYYSIVSVSRDYFEQLLLKFGKGRKSLEYGCGPGSYAFYLAENGSDAVGIDISYVAVMQASEKAREQGLDNLEFLVMDAEHMTFGDNTFDLICGKNILHHLNLDKSFSEISRTLKPGGYAVFIEPLGHNPFINLFRKLTPNVRTVDESPLKIKDLKKAEEYFEKVDLRFFHLQSLLAIPLRNTSFFQSLVDILDKMDKSLFKIFPFMGRYAWEVIMIMRKK